ncbi:MAG: hypothetical protein ACKOTB_01915, partial [Planctomycetia bacterium]
VGALVACLAARDARGAIAAFDEAISGGADPGGLLEQGLAALRDALLASVGCGPELMHAGNAIGLDLAALGRDTGTVTLLAMLQIIDHALARMRPSCHAGVLAELALGRRARLDELDGLADAVARVAAVAPGPRAPADRSPPVEKKKADVTAAVAVALPAAEPAAVETAPHDSGPGEGSPGSPETGTAVPQARERGGSPPAVEPDVSVAVAASAVEPLDAWRQAAEAVGGLAVDFAHLAVRATWRDDLLEVALPPTSGNAASFLRRPEVASAVARALREGCGREVRVSIVIEAVAAPSAGRPRGAAPEAVEDRPRPAPSQAALVREVAAHPLVVHAQAVFDAAVRTVEPPRQRATAAAIARRLAQIVEAEGASVA